MTATPDDVVIESCSTCRFFVPGASKHAPGADGACHRSAPMQWSSIPVEETVDQSDADTGDSWGVVTMTTFGSYFGWPAILASDWCGEWEARR